MNASQHDIEDPYNLSDFYQILRQIPTWHTAHQELRFQVLNPMLLVQVFD